MAKTLFGEEEDPTSRYQNPRYSGKNVPNRANNEKRKIKFSELNATKLFPSGGYEVSHMEDGQRKSQKYYGYSKREALKKYRGDN